MTDPRELVDILAAKYYKVSPFGVSISEAQEFAKAIEALIDAKLAQRRAVPVMEVGMPNQ